MTSCGCRCIRCKATGLSTQTLARVHADGEPDMHHTCKECNAHFDHLEGDIFESCTECGYRT